jgi:hypothetical protein
VICVLQALEDGVLNRHATFPQLHLDGLGAGVDVLHPQMVVLSCSFGDVLLEDDHVRVGDLLAVDARHDRGCIIMNSTDNDWRASRQQREAETDEVLHGEDDDDDDDGTKR